MFAGGGEVAQGANLFGDGGGKKDGPGEDPEDEVEPEEPDGGEAVVVRDAFGEKAGDVLVVEIEPGPACRGREAETLRKSDGRVAEGGEDVPGGCEGEEDCGACEEVEFEEEVELFCYCEVEEDEGDGEDEADEALGEDVQGHDGREGEAGQEGGCLLLSVNAVECDQEEVDGESHPESEQDVRNVEAGVEIWADACGHGESGVEASTVGACGG